MHNQTLVYLGCVLTCVCAHHVRNRDINKHLCITRNEKNTNYPQEGRLIFEGGVPIPPLTLPLPDKQAGIVYVFGIERRDMLKYVEKRLNHLNICPPNI